MYICIYIYMYIGQAVFSNITWVQTTMSTAAAWVGDCWEIICKERDTLSEAVVSLRSVVTFVTWLILEQDFLVRNLLYNDICLDLLFMRLDGERRLSRCLPNISTSVPNDSSQCLYCVLPTIRCAIGAHLDVGLAEQRTPCRFVGNLTFPSLFLGEDVHLWRKEIAQGHIPRVCLWVQSRFTLLHPCTALFTTSHLMESANSFLFCWNFGLSTNNLEIAQGNWGLLTLGCCSMFGYLWLFQEVYEIYFS